MTGPDARGGERYTPGENQVECIDAMETVVANYTDPACGMLATMAIKQIWRADKKGGIDSINKAIDYLNRLRARMDGRPGQWDRRRDQAVDKPGDN